MRPLPGPARAAAAVAALALLAVSDGLAVSGSSTITTIAGTGMAGFSGDGGKGTSAQLNSPNGVAVDQQGNVYIADSLNQRVRKLSNGTIGPFAGTGSTGFSNDFGSPLAAKLNTPTGVAVDGDGTVYIADTFNQRVRKVSRGTIATIAGSGDQGFAGDGGPGTSAKLNNPVGVAVDAAGNVYVADTYNNRVRKLSGSTITTIAGTGAKGFSGDGGSGTAAELNHPAGVAVDRGGNVYIADTENNRVRELRTDGTITTVAGSGIPGSAGDGGAAISAQLNYPYGIAVDGIGDLYVAELNNHLVRKISGRTIETIAGTGVSGSSGDGGPASAAQLQLPYSVAVDKEGDVYIADAGSHRIRKISNVPPQVSFTVTPASGRVPLKVSFDASASRDPDGQIVENYAWQFGDGATGTGTKTSHTYARAGKYTAKLTLRDDAGATASSTRAITVTSAPAATTTTTPPKAPSQPAALKLTLRGATSQRLLAQGAVTLTVACDKPCSITTTATVRIAGTRSVLGLTKATADLPAAGSSTLRLLIPKPAEQRFRRLLKPHGRGRVTITVHAADGAGHRVISTRIVAVRR